MTEYILIGSFSLIWAALIAGSYYIGSKHKESKIRAKGLKDVDKHYEKLFENNKKIDDLIDAVADKLRKSNKSRVPEVSKAKANKDSKKIKPKNNK